jgi:hypothetical protein
MNFETPSKLELALARVCLNRPVCHRAWKKQKGLASTPLRLNYLALQALVTCLTQLLKHNKAVPEDSRQGWHPTCFRS